MEKTVSSGASSGRFPKPSVFRRIGSMLGVDFYRLFHTPMYYIFLCVAAIIPALILCMGGMSEGAEPLYENTWSLIAADTPLYAVSEIGEYANMDMVYIFGGIMISVFIGHDYRSGYVKQLFTVHSKKQDYMISKTLAGAFSMACMCATYLIATVFAGFISGSSFEVEAGSLIIAVLGKLIMCFGWSAFYTFINILLRRHFAVSIILCFVFGTGIHVIVAGMIFGNSALLNIFLYGSSVYACLSATPVALIVCLACSLGWGVFYTALGSLVLSRSDVY